MSTKSNFISTQKIPQEATQLNKLTKVSSDYIEIGLLKILTLIENIFAFLNQMKWFGNC
jgi:hypothetical protein